MMSLITRTGRVPNTIVAGWGLGFDALTVVTCQFLTGEVATHHPEALHFQAYFFTLDSRLCAESRCILSPEHAKPKD